MRKFAAAAALAALAFGPAGALAQTGQSLSGTWTGLVTQTFVDGRTATFTAMISIQPGGTAESAYPSDACGGTLTLLSRKGTLSFQETITYGVDICADGIVTLVQAGDTLTYHWTSTEDGTAEGTLRLTDKTIPPH
ncbi:MAG: hypothetical protein ACWA6X_13610 [Bauldia sp.]